MSVRRSVGPSVPHYFQTRTRRILCRVSGLVYRLGNGHKLLPPIDSYPISIFYLSLIFLGLAAAQNNIAKNKNGNISQARGHGYWILTNHASPIQRQSRGSMSTDPTIFPCQVYVWRLKKSGFQIFPNQGFLFIVHHWYSLMRGGGGAILTQKKRLKTSSTNDKISSRAAREKIKKGINLRQKIYNPVAVSFL